MAQNIIDVVCRKLEYAAGECELWEHGEDVSTAAVEFRGAALRLKSYFAELEQRLKKLEGAVNMDSSEAITMKHDLLNAVNSISPDYDNRFAVQYQELRRVLDEYFAKVKP